MEMQQRGMDSNLRRDDRRAVDFTATLVSKAPVLFLAVLSGGLVARTALPAVAGVLSSGTAPLWSASRPLYPFFFVNLIIFVIWRLSDWEQHGPVEEKPPEAGVLVKVKSSDANPIEPLARKPSLETKEISASSPIAPAVPAVVPVTVPAPARRHVELPQASEKSVVCWEFGTKISLSEGSAKVALEEVPVPALEDARKGEVEEEDDEENPPMEVMWKAIVEKRMRETATTSRLVTPPRGQRLKEAVVARPLPVLGGREPSPVASRDESERLYNDFIMNRRNKMRL